MENEYLQNIYNLLECDQETLMRPPGHNSQMPLFTSQESEQIFYAIILYFANKLDLE